MKLMKQTLTILTILVIVSILVPYANVNAAWYIDMKSSQDKSGYETVIAKDKVYGLFYDTVSVFEGLTSKTKILSVKSNNTKVLAKVHYYTDHGEDQYSILAKCSSSKQSQEAATITVKCFSKNNKKYYTRKLFVSFSNSYNYNIVKSLSMEKDTAKELNLSRTSSIKSQLLDYKEFLPYNFTYNPVEQSNICHTAFAKENGTLSITGIGIGSTTLNIQTTYINGETITNRISVKVLDSTSCIVNENKNVVMGNKVFNLYNLVNRNAKITVTNSDQTVVNYHLQIRTTKEIADSFHYKLAKTDNPNERIALLYFEGLKEGKSTVYVTYTITEKGTKTTYKYRYNIEVLPESKKESEQSITFVNYENNLLYQEDGLLTDLSGNPLQSWGNLITIVPNSENLSNYYTWDNLCKFTMEKPQNSDVTVTIKDLYNKEFTKFTKTFTPKERVATESSDIIFRSESDATKFFCHDNGLWQSKNGDSLYLHDNKIAAYNAGSGNPMTFGDKEIELDSNAMFSIDILKKEIVIKDGDFSLAIPYRVIDKERVIMKLDGIWRLFSLK